MPITTLNSNALNYLSKNDINNKEISLNNKTYVNPKNRSTINDKTYSLVIEQTTAARCVLYFPGDVLRNELSQAAGMLYKIYNNLSLDEQLIVAQRIFSPSGLMVNEYPVNLLDVLYRVQHLDNASAHDRAVVFSLMGDLGAMYAGELKKNPKDKEKQTCISISKIATSLGLDAPNEQSIHEVRKKGASVIIGPDKKLEKVKSDEYSARTGIHNFGGEVDRRLGITHQAAIPATVWNVAYFENTRLSSTIEPLVGHMSGTPAEILQIWDMLRGKKASEQFIGILNSGTHQHNKMLMLSPEEQKQHFARAAGTGAFLVALGYHSAVEVIENILTYTGQSLREHNILSDNQKDAAHLFGEGAATMLMTELFLSNLSEALPDRISSLLNQRTAGELI